MGAQLLTHWRYSRSFIPVVVGRQLSGEFRPWRVVGKDDADPVTVADDGTSPVGASRARHYAQHTRLRFHDDLTSCHLAHNQHECIERQLNPFPDPLPIILQEDPTIG